MAKNQQNGIAQNLDSEATKNSQPNKLFIPGSKSIPGADPEQPSINNATRREQYAIDNTPSYDRGASSDVPESTKIGGYNTVAGSMPKSYYPQQQTTTEDYLGAIKKLPGFSYYTNDFDNQLKEVERSLREQGIDTTIDAYGQYMTEAAKQMATIDMQLGYLQSQENQVTNTQASNALLVYTLAKEVWSGLAQGQSIQQIAQNLGQEERVIQKIANNQTEELVQLNAEYEEEQLRSYLRNREDLDISIARNIAQYNNLQKNLDYQFDSAMETLRRNEFDAKRAAQETSGIYGMTGTEYTLNRIQKQYDQQMGDIKNTYNYQSANAQMAINNALEDYSNNLKRRAEDYAQARKGIQGYALQTIMNIENNIGLSADQMAEALTTAYKNVTAAQSNAMSTYLEALDNGNATLATQIANAYGLNVSGVGKMRTERNNNPTAMITAKAKQLGGVLGVDYEIGDSFTGSDGRTYYTARLIGDPIETTIRLLDRGLEKGLSNIFSGWSYASKLGLNNEVRRNATPEEKKEIVYKMLAEEGGNMELMRYYAENGGMSTGGMSTEEGDYYEGDVGLYQQYLQGKNISSIMASVKKNASYGKTEEERVTNFAKAAEAYGKIASKETASVVLDSAKQLYKLNEAWSQLSDNARMFIRTKWGRGISDWRSSGILKNKMSEMGLGENEFGAVSHFLALYDNVVAKGFIDTLINSKTQGAAYGQLSDAEGAKISKAWSSLSLSDPANFTPTLNEMFGTMTEKLKKWGYSSEEIQDYVGGKLTPNSTEAQSEFNIPGAAYTPTTGTNYTGAQQSGTVNTGIQQMWQ